MINNAISNSASVSEKIYGESPKSIDHPTMGTTVTLIGLTHKPFCVIYLADYYGSPNFFARMLYLEDENGHVIKNSIACYSTSSGSYYSGNITAEYSESEGRLALTTDGGALSWGAPGRDIEASSFTCIYVE